MKRGWRKFKIVGVAAIAIASAHLWAAEPSCSTLLSAEGFLAHAKFEANGQVYYRRPLTSDALMGHHVNYIVAETEYYRVKEQRNHTPFYRWTRRRQLSRRMKELAEQIEKSAVDYKEQRNRDRADLVARFENDLKEPALKNSLEDFLNVFRIQSLDTSRTVGLFFGTSGAQVDPQVLNQLISLVHGLKSKGYTFVYDADSPYAPYIREINDWRGISLGASKNSDIRIEDPYLRFKALSSLRKMVVGPDSVLGFAMTLYGARPLVLDPRWHSRNLSHRWTSQWTKGIVKAGEGLGYKLGSLIVATDARDLFNKKGKDSNGVEYHILENVDGRLSHEDRGRAFTLIPNDLSYENLQEALSDSYAKVAGRDLLKDVNVGAAVFGSAEIPHVTFNRKAYDALFALAQLNIPFTTGGSGGFMKLANAAAFEAGTDSVGINIAGRNSQDVEARTYFELHTDTFEAPSYGSRIPLFFEGKELVIVLPGRRGTMREIATAFFIALEENSRMQVIFFGRTYYGNLLRAMERQDLPQDFKERIHLVDSKQELVGLVKKQIENGKLNSERVFSKRVLQSRALSLEEKSFLIEKKEDGKHESGKGPG